MYITVSLELWTMNRSGKNLTYLMQLSRSNNAYGQPLSKVFLVLDAVIKGIIYFVMKSCLLSQIMCTLHRMCFLTKLVACRSDTTFIRARTLVKTTILSNH